MVPDFPPTTVVILAGVPASGKSTFFARHLSGRGLRVLSTDNIIEEMAAAQGKTYDEVFSSCISAATHKFYRDIRNAVSENVGFVVDRTNLTRTARRKILRMVPDYYHKVCIVFDVPDDIEHKRRLANRPGKTIPDHVIEEMKRIFQEPTEDEGFDTIIFVRNSQQ